MLEGKVLAPTDAIVVGGPAPFMAKQIGKLLKMKEIVPGDSDVINASGAAMARTTVELTLMADTEERLMSVAEEGVQTDIPRGFTIEDLIEIGREKLEKIARIAGAPQEDIEIEVADSQSFNVIRGTATTGKNFRVRLQIKPGLTKHATEHAVEQ
jgi:hypothetical protein